MPHACCVRRTGWAMGLDRKAILSVVAHGEALRLSPEPKWQQQDYQFVHIRITVVSYLKIQNAYILVEHSPLLASPWCLFF